MELDDVGRLSMQSLTVAASIYVMDAELMLR
jgi:hypothetical protein